MGDDVKQAVSGLVYVSKPPFLSACFTKIVGGVFGVQTVVMSKTRSGPASRKKKR